MACRARTACRRWRIRRRRKRGRSGRATELAELRYKEGDISYLELLDVRRDYYQTQINLISTHRDALTNTVDLALALRRRHRRRRRAA
jgi:outer membrane protein TolC